MKLFRLKFSSAPPPPPSQIKVIFRCFCIPSSIFFLNGGREKTSNQAWLKKSITQCTWMFCLKLLFQQSIRWFLMPLPLCTPHQVSVVKPLLRLFKVALLFVFVHYRTQSLPYNGELSVICTSGTSDQIQEKEKNNG